MNSKIILLALVLVTVSCGKKSGGSSSIERRETAQDGACTEKFYDTHNLSSIASQANEIRIRCGLSEEDVVRMAGNNLRLQD